MPSVFLRAPLLRLLILTDMKMTKFTRFVRVNLIGLLALMNVIAIFVKFRVERPQTITYKCMGKHPPLYTNQVSQVSAMPSALAARDMPMPRQKVSHTVRGDWDGELKEATCDYTSAVVDGVPILQTGTNRYVRRGDLTRWGRVLWIGADFFTTDKAIVRLQEEQRQVASVERGSNDIR